ncbi:hypothetical protein BC936DRAFT_145134 [Jimgerdemannia flammicorona]|uniref:Amino-acid acetyltransferase, mitochondrial n=1 Tax=Jimgerdemannia flammicorona TaxID=994334 RepID=A0A433DAV3_9FUNG|nr:hypothetical protein BC936DRAFT_145134 [Jimgerdemannia flammicorona]
MRTIPTQRELRHFLKRYIPPKEVVDSLLRPSHRHIALTKVQGPFVPAQLASVASTLVQLCRLGLTSVVVLENEEWACVQPNEPAEEEALRLSMLRESLAITEAIEKVGGRARPVTSDVFWEPEGDGWNEIKSASEGEQDTPTLRASLDLVQSALRNEQIPIILPIASFPGSIKRPVPANNAMVALCRSLAQPNHVIPTSSAILDSTLLPVKLVVINKEGGIPNHEKPGTAHSLINLVEEHDGIVHAYRSTPQWHNSHPTALQNLEMVRYCLALLPTTSSAIVVPCASLPHALISNLITDKPLYSSSLPTNRGGTPHLITTINTSHATVLRHGMSIAYHPSMDSVERPAMTALLEASFGRRLDANAFYERLERRLVCAIVAGGYEGAVIVTGEPAVGEVEAETEVGKYYYLDKFAIAPTSQGIGLTDILWKRMTDAYPDIMWRSRADNGVNKW